MRKSNGEQLSTKFSTPPCRRVPSSSPTSTKKKRAQRHTQGGQEWQGLSLENLTSLPSSTDPVRDPLAPWQL